MPKEIEIRNKLFNEEEVLTFLKKNNAVFLKEVNQADTYFDNSDDSFFKDVNHVNDWIRIREENGELSFNYKHWLPEGAEIRTYCEEKEYPMKSKEDFNTILSNLGFSNNFEPFITVEKNRKSFMYKDCEISIDKVKDLGTFLEIEYKGKNNDVLEVQNLLHSILKETSAVIGPADHKGHAYNILLKNKSKVLQKNKN